MDKRHGIDEFGVALIWFATLLMAVSYFLKNTVLSTIAAFIVAFEIFRTISKNNLQRNSENYVFKAKFLNPVKTSLRRLKRSTIGDKDYKYIKCNSCGQELRIPKGKGKIKVKCPKCKQSQEVRS